jgi:cell filamentation protein, protein adenylyltransferase
VAQTSREQDKAVIDFGNLDSLKQQLDEMRPLPPEVVANLREDLVLRWTYHSNAIEGNTLTLKETKVALEGVTVGGKTLREHLEAINHRDAIAYVESMVGGEETLTLHSIRSIHQLILKNIDDENAGVWRRFNVTIAGAEHTPPDVTQVPQLMEDFVKWRHEQERICHPVELATRTHVDLVKIHPFADGNGRTARILMNLDLLRAGFPPVVLPVESRLAYYDALDAAHVHGNYADILDLVGSLAEKVFEPYFRALS